jgi:hypothetical protein
MAEQNIVVNETQNMTRHQRYYALHREEKLAKVKERYKNDPEFIAKQQEKERKKAEKEAEKEAQKEAKRIEKEMIRQKKLAVALATKKQSKKDSESLDSVLGQDLSGER